MTKTLYVLLVISVAAIAQSQDSELPEKAQKLRDSYRTAIDRVTGPLTKTYLAELERLKVEYTKAAT